MTGRKGASCAGQNGYEDITAGAQVVVQDNSDKTVGLGQLDGGVMSDRVSSVDAQCVFAFSVSDVPAAGNIFSIEVAHRGQVKFKRANADSVSLTLGP